MKVFGIKCLKCGEIIYSRARHDFHWCHCGACAIDGGQEDYIRIIGDQENWEKVSDITISAKNPETLYKDWNLGKNKYGWIKPESHK